MHVLIQDFDGGFRFKGLHYSVIQDFRAHKRFLCKDDKAVLVVGIVFCIMILINLHYSSPLKL